MNPECHAGARGALKAARVRSEVNLAGTGQIHRWVGFGSGNGGSGDYYEVVDRYFHGAQDSGDRWLRAA